MIVEISAPLLANGLTPEHMATSGQLGCRRAGQRNTCTCLTRVEPGFLLLPLGRKRRRLHFIYGSPGAGSPHLKTTAGPANHQDSGTPVQGGEAGEARCQVQRRPGSEHPCLLVGLTYEHSEVAGTHVQGRLLKIQRKPLQQHLGWGSEQEVFHFFGDQGKRQINLLSLRQLL